MRDAFHDESFHHRHLRQTQHGVVLEIVLLHPALIKVDLSIQSGRQTEGDCPLDLLSDQIRVDGSAKTKEYDITEQLWVISRWISDETMFARLMH